MSLLDKKIKKIKIVSEQGDQQSERTRDFWYVVQYVDGKMMFISGAYRSKDEADKIACEHRRALGLNKEYACSCCCDGNELLELVWAANAREALSTFIAMLGDRIEDATFIKVVLT